MSIALFKVCATSFKIFTYYPSLPQLTSHEVLPSPERMNLNFQRRYKWLCAAREDDPDALLFPFPPLSEFFAEIETVREVGPFWSRIVENGQYLFMHPDGQFSPRSAQHRSRCAVSPLSN